jgi:distribution and morphology protein 31
MDEISLKVSILFYFSYKQRFHISQYTFSLQIYDALAYHVSQAAMNRRRMKTVSLWSLQMTVGAVLSALRNSIDPMSAQLKETYTHGSSQLETNFHHVLPLVLDGVVG